MVTDEQVRTLRTWLGKEASLTFAAAKAGMDRKTARAEVQQILGLSRWIREATLYRTIKGSSTIALSMSVEIRYDAPITKIALRRRLSKFIGKAQGFNT